MTYPKFSATFFDLDGTLVDTGLPHRAAEQATLQVFGIDAFADDHPDTFGHGVILGSRMVEDHYGLIDTEDLLDEYLPMESIRFQGLNLLSEPLRHLVNVLMPTDLSRW